MCFFFSPWRGSHPQASQALKKYLHRQSHIAFKDCAINNVSLLSLFASFGSVVGLTDLTVNLM